MSKYEFLLGSIPPNTRFYLKQLGDQRWFKSDDPLRDSHLGAMFAETSTVSDGLLIVDTGFITLKRNNFPTGKRWQFYDDIYTLMLTGCESPAVFYSITPGLVDGLLCCSETDAILASAFYTNARHEQ